MKYGIDKYVIICETVQHGVRESSDNRPTKVFLDHGIGLGHLSDAVECGLDLINELAA